MDEPTEFLGADGLDPENPSTTAAHRFQPALPIFKGDPISSSDSSCTLRPLLDGGKNARWHIRQILAINLLITVFVLFLLLFFMGYVIRMDRRLSEGIEFLMKELKRTKGQDAFKLAESSRVFFQWPYPEGGVGVGCGTYIYANGEYFVATNAPVLAQALATHQRPDMFTRTRHLLSYRADPFYFDPEIGPDLGVVPVHEYDGPDKSDIHPVTLLGCLPELGTEVFAISSGLADRTAIRCSIDSELHDHTLMGNCRPAPQYSGTGFLDKNGFLACLLKGPGESPHTDVRSNGTLSDVSDETDKRWRHLEEVCQPGWSPPTATPLRSFHGVGQPPSTPFPGPTPVLKHECFHAARKALMDALVNPATHLVPAHFLLELLKRHNATRQLIITLRPKPGNL
jgi:hypothetical protein